MVGIATMLAEARAAGLTVGIDGDRLVVHGPRRCEAKAKALLARKPDVVDYLNEHAATGGESSSTWDAADWQAHFHERAAIREHDGELPRPEAERLAFEDTISLWQFRHPPEPTDDVVCVHCDAALDDDAIPVLAGDSGHVWLHGRCHHDWLAERRAEARRALVAMGVAAANSGRGHSA